MWNKVTDERTGSKHSSRDHATGPWRGSSALFYLIVMQMMFSTKIANLLARCHPVRKAYVDKAAFFSHFCSNKLTSSAEHFNLIISRGRGMVFNNHRASCREASPFPLLRFRSHWDRCACACLRIDGCRQVHLLSLSEQQ